MSDNVENELLQVEACVKITILSLIKPALGGIMDWLNSIPAKVNEDGYLQLMPENDEAKSVKKVAPHLDKVAEYIISNDFPGVLSEAK
jgi:hypothetical protein